MEFVPFDPPPSDHHGLATGHTTESGVTARGLVEGVNEAFRHLFGVIGGKKDDTAERIDALEDLVAARIAALQKRNDELDAHVKALLASFDTLTSQVSHIQSAALNEAPKPADPAPQNA